MKHTIRTASCIAAALALGGCQSFINSLGFGPRDSAQTERRAEVFGSEEIERGQLALKEGHVTMAIQQFRMAALNEKYAADAFNGLGVAYARLGRADLAERYFRTAVELDTANPKYAANLARFYESALGTSARALAMREREAEAMLARAEQAAAEQGLTGTTAETAVAANSAVTVLRPQAMVTQGENRELRIAAAPVAETRVAQPAPAVAARGSTINNRVTLIGTAPKRAGAAKVASGPVRITISRGGTTAASAPRAASYPVRVALKRKD